MPRDNMMLFVGLEIGGTNLKAGILDGETGKLAGSFRQEPLLFNGSQDVESEAVIEQLVALGKSALDEQGISWTDALYVGIACPGQIDREAGTLVGASTFPAWRDVPLAAMVQERTGRPVTVLNDASAAASAEFAGRGSQETIAVLTLGTGIGLGVVSAGRVVTGSRGLIEGGHMIVEPGPDGRLCPCGQRGCLEAYASASAVVAITSERMRNNRRAQASPTNGDAPHPSPPPASARRKSVRTAASDNAQAAPVFPRRRSLGGPLGSPSGVGKRIRELERRSSTDERGFAPFASPSRKAPDVSPRDGSGVAGGEQAVGNGENTWPAVPSAAVVAAEAVAEAAAAMAAASSVACGDPDGGGGGGGDGCGGGAMTAVDVVSMAMRGDEVAMGVFQEACSYIGLACVNICRLVDPDVILLAGGLSNAEGLVDKVREAFYSRGWKILPHECEIGLASACASGSSGVVGAAGAAACEFALAARRSRGKRVSSSSSRASRAGRRSVPPCGVGPDSGAAAAVGATATAANAAGGNGEAVKGHRRANGSGSSADAERRTERSTGRSTKEGTERSADTGIAGSDARDQNIAGASGSAKNGAGTREMLDGTALSEEGFSRAKPEGYGGVGDGGRGARRQSGGGGGWKWFAAGVGFGASAAVLAAAAAAAAAASGKVKLDRVRFLR